MSKLKNFLSFNAVSFTLFNLVEFYLNLSGSANSVIFHFRIWRFYVGLEIANETYTKCDYQFNLSPYCGYMRNLHQLKECELMLAIAQCIAVGGDKPDLYKKIAKIYNLSDADLEEADGDILYNLRYAMLRLESLKRAINQHKESLEGDEED